MFFTAHYHSTVTRMLNRCSLATALCLVAAVAVAQDAANSTTKGAKLMPKDLLKKLTGKWEGTVKTWFRPGELADESEVKGEFTEAFGGKFVRHVYEGSMKGKPRHGEELIAYNPVKKQFQVSWVDTFHMSYGILFSEGDPTDTGFLVKGMYDTGPNTPQWGWNTAFDLTDDDHLTITMYNVLPDGREAKAVEVRYVRRK